MNFNKITFKKSNGSNEDFLKLKTIHMISMKNNVIKSIGEWNDEFQNKRLKKHFQESNKTLEFIYYENQLIGTINCSLKFDENEFIYVEQFYLLPIYQGKGLGSFIFDIKLKNKESRLSVLKNDTKTHQFYFKHGFVEYQEDEYQKYLKKIPNLK